MANKQTMPRAEVITRTFQNGAYGLHFHTDEMTGRVELSVEVSGLPIVPGDLYHTFIAELRASCPELSTRDLETSMDDYIDDLHSKIISKRLGNAFIDADRQ